MAGFRKKIERRYRGNLIVAGNFSKNGWGHHRKKEAIKIKKNSSILILYPSKEPGLAETDDGKVFLKLFLLLQSANFIKMNSRYTGKGAFFAGKFNTLFRDLLIKRVSKKDFAKRTGSFLPLRKSMSNPQKKRQPKEHLRKQMKLNYTERIKDEGEKKRKTKMWWEIS